MTIRPLADQIVIRKDSLDTDEIGMISTPSGVSHRPDAIWRGTVIAVGPGIVRYDKRNKRLHREDHDIRPGMRVHYEHLQGFEFEPGGAGVHALVRAKFVIAEETA